MSAFRSTLTAMLTSSARSTGDYGAAPRLRPASGGVTSAPDDGGPATAPRASASSRPRARYVAQGVAVSPVVVDRAEGARLWDVDGRSYVDFAGGIGCQNTGHDFRAAVAAIHEQVDRYLHQCFMVSAYEPYVEVCRRLAELSPVRRGRAAERPRQLGRGGGRERGQDLARRDRPPGRRRLRLRLPRPNAARR